MEPMIYKTERLIVRSPLPSDADILAEGRNTPFVRRYNLYGVSSGENVLRELETYRTFVLDEQGKAAAIGCIYAKDDLFRYHVKSLELSGWLKEEYARLGYMTEALIKVMEILFSEGVERLSAWVFSENTASLKLMNKVGFLQEGILHEGCRRGDGKVFDVCLFSVGRKEWLGKKAQDG